MFVFRAALRADESSVRVRVRVRVRTCMFTCVHSASEDASNSSLFLGAIWNFSCPLNPTLTRTHRHTH